MKSPIASCIGLLFACGAFAQPAPTTRPGIPLPSHFSDDRQGISIELAGRDNDSSAIVGTISLGGASRRFTLSARLDGALAAGTFSTDMGDIFPCTLQMDGLRLLLKTGRTSYQLSRTTGGIGITIDQTTWRITTTLQGKPAQEAGIRVGDVITAVNGNDVASSDLQSNPLRGPVYTKVQVTVRRADGSTADFTMTRVPIDLSPLPPPRVEDVGDGVRDR
jgi:hypothetical protein